MDCNAVNSYLIPYKAYMIMEQIKATIEKLQHCSRKRPALQGDISETCAA